VLSVNVGCPAETVWHGRTVRSAIWKTPVIGLVTTRGVNLVGDAQADRKAHGGPDKALYAYAAEDLVWWNGQLGLELGPGNMGENLTTSGLQLSQAVIGERWQVGSVVLQVAQPRIPYYKLGIRIGDDRFPARFAEARRHGVYLRILAEGEKPVTRSRSSSAPRTGSGRSRWPTSSTTSAIGPPSFSACLSSRRPGTTGRARCSPRRGRGGARAPSVLS